LAPTKDKSPVSKHELAVTKYHLDQLRYGPQPEPYSGQIVGLAREAAELRARVIDNPPARELGRELSRRIVSSRGVS